MTKEEKENYTKLLEIDVGWLIEFLTDMIVESDEDFESAIRRQDRDDVSGIIERYIY